MMLNAGVTANSPGFDKTTPRAVIFSADDFGLSKSTTSGIITCHRAGIVRSTSLMAGGAAFDEAAAYALGNESLDAGLHLALCEVRPVCDPAEIPSLVTRDGFFHPGFGAFLRRYLTGGVSKGEVEKEFRAQLNKALNTGLRISHLDSHQHLHALPSIFEITARLAAEFHIPAVRCPDERGAPVISAMLQGRASRALQRIALSASSRLGGRSLTRHGIATTGHFSGFMDMGRWNEASLRARIRSLRPGLTEICCHPRSEPGTEPGCNFQAEMEALADAGLQQFLAQEKVMVTSFREYFTTPATPGDDPAIA